MSGNLSMALVVAGFFQEHVVIVEWERGLLGWILLG